jgi:hypothetical protein
MPNSRARLFNTLSLALLVLTAVMCAAFAAIFLLVPPSPQLAALPTHTPGPSQTPSPSPTTTRTPRLTNTPTDTSTPSPTPTPPIGGTLTGSETPTPSPTAGPPQTPSPTLSPFNFVAGVEYQRSIYGQNWAGIAGLVFGLDRRHATNILVRAWGDAPLGADGQEIPSGIAVQYGVSGFEFTLGDGPLTGKWNVQLLGDDGQPLSDVVAVEMNSDPRFNLAYIIFEQNH